MTVTRKNIQNHFGILPENIKQYGSKQLFLIDTENGRFLVSYFTIVGKYNCETGWILTQYKYSNTTTKQVNWFALQTIFSVTWIDEEISYS